jgi:hypothetical protein
MSKPGKSLKGLCKKLGVRLTVKRGKKRVYKSVAVLKRQCAKKKKRSKKKVKKKVKRKRRKFGSRSQEETQERGPRTGNTQDSEDGSVYGDGGGGYEDFLCPQRSDLGGPCTIQGCYGGCEYNMPESPPPASGQNTPLSLNLYDDDDVLPVTPPQSIDYDNNPLYTPGSRQPSQSSQEIERRYEEVKKQQKEKRKRETNP